MKTRIYLSVLLLVIVGFLVVVSQEPFGHRIRRAVLEGPSGSAGGAIYLQTDPRWVDARIGGSGEKMRAVGCTVCCASMALEYCGFAIDPGRLNKLLKENHGYTKQGWLKWYALPRLIGNTIRVETPDSVSADLIDSTLQTGYPVMAKVMIGKRIPHWVLIAGKKDGEYLIKDPLGDGRGLEKLSKYASDVHSIRILKNRKALRSNAAASQGQVTSDERIANGEAAEKKDSTLTQVDAFANAARHGKPTVAIWSSIDGGQWVKPGAIYPLKGRQVRLKVDKVAGAQARWFQIVPDISKTYKNANYPWEEKPYEWAGFAKIDYDRKELPQFRGLWLIQPFETEKGNSIQEQLSSFGGPQSRTMNSRIHREDVGSFWFQVEVAKDGIIYRSAGIEDSDEKGLSPQVFRVSIREGDGYLGYLTSFFNVPGLFGSVTYQSENYIGVDCADVLVAACAKWKNRPMRKNYNVAMVVSEWPRIKEFDLREGAGSEQVSWGRHIRPGDFIAVRYRGGRQYQHIGALYSDANANDILDADDLVIHAGPEPLHYSYLSGGNFDGHVVIIRPE
jgi:hypothetical protein